MGLLSAVDRAPKEVPLGYNKCLSPRLGNAYLASQAIYAAGAEGLAWRVKSGVVRLDTTTKNGDPSFASLAIPGDIVGCETMLFGTYTFTASALTHCELSPWPEGEPAGASESLLESLGLAGWCCRRGRILLILPICVLKPFHASSGGWSGLVSCCPLKWKVFMRRVVTR